MLIRAGLFAAVAGTATTLALPAWSALLVKRAPVLPTGGDASLHALAAHPDFSAHALEQAARNHQMQAHNHAAQQLRAHTYNQQLESHMQHVSRGVTAAGEFAKTLPPEGSSPCANFYHQVSHAKAQAGANAASSLLQVHTHNTAVAGLHAQLAECSQHLSTLYGRLRHEVHGQGGHLPVSHAPATAVVSHAPPPSPMQAPGSPFEGIDFTHFPSMPMSPLLGSPMRSGFAPPSPAGGGHHHGGHLGLDSPQRGGDSPDHHAPASRPGSPVTSAGLAVHGSPEHGWTHLLDDIAPPGLGMLNSPPASPSYRSQLHKLHGGGGSSLSRHDLASSSATVEQPGLGGGGVGSASLSHATFNMPSPSPSASLSLAASIPKRPRGARRYGPATPPASPFAENDFLVDPDEPQQQQHHHHHAPPPSPKRARVGEQSAGASTAAGPSGFAFAGAGHYADGYGPGGRRR